jgi:hypothetical protein
MLNSSRMREQKHKARSKNQIALFSDVALSSMLNRNQVCRLCSLQMIKIMQMETLNVTVLMPPERPLVMIAMYFV